LRQNFNDEDKQILRQFGFRIGLAIIGVIIAIALALELVCPRPLVRVSKRQTLF